MSDIVERLRENGDYVLSLARMNGLPEWPAIQHEAANEIEQLRAERDALKSSAMTGYEDGWHKLRRERDELRERIEARTMERDHWRTRFDYAIRHLSAIHMVMKPDKVELPDGRVFEFSNPDIEREMLTALCARIREIPSVLEKARHLND